MIAPGSLADTMSVLLITRSIYNDYRSVYIVTVLTTPGSETVWPSGKALGCMQRNLGSNQLRLSFSLQMLWSVDTVL